MRAFLVSSAIIAACRSPPSASDAGPTASPEAAPPDAALFAVPPSASSEASERLAPPDAAVRSAGALDVEGAVAALRPRYRQCVARGLAVDPTTPKLIVVAVTSDASGRIVRVEATTTPPAPAETISCITGVTKTIVLRPSAAARTFTIRMNVDSQGTWSSFAFAFARLRVCASFALRQAGLCRNRVARVDRRSRAPHAWQDVARGSG